MTNVLPEKALRAVWSGFRNRLILVGALIFFGAAAFFGLALLPAYVVLQVERNVLEQEIISAGSQDTNPENRAERDEMIRSQALLARITPFIYATTSATKLLDTALALRPEGVQINHISVMSKNGLRITLEGVAPGREETNQYHEALSKDKSFSSVLIPAVALAGVEGGKFTITLTSAQ